MHIIEVTQVNHLWTLKKILKPLSKLIKGNFEVLKIGQVGKKGPDNKQYKTCFVRLSPKLDPHEVIKEIRRNGLFGAHLADSNCKVNECKKGLRPNNRFRQQLEELSPDMVVMHTHREILMEMQSKYTGLFNLNMRTGNKLIEGIAQTILERLEVIKETNPDAMESGFTLSKCYRKLHPHFGDFQLILSTLHRLQDAAATPRAQISEQELTVVNAQPYVIDNVPYEMVKHSCNKYSDRIVKKVTEHISNLKTDIAQTDGEEDVARKRVRQELKKISHYLPLMISQVIRNHFIPQKSPFQRVRIYGEPHLPTKEQTAPFLRRYNAVKIMRSDRMYNVLRFNIPLAQYASLLAMDGTVIGGSKLVIRSSDIPLCKFSTSLLGMETSEDVEADADEDTAWKHNWAEDMVL